MPKANRRGEIECLRCARPAGECIRRGGNAQPPAEILQAMGPQIQWVQSYVTDDKIYCVYNAPDEAAVKSNAQQGGFPANTISPVRSMIDPTTAD